MRTILHAGILAALMFWASGCAHHRNRSEFCHADLACGLNSNIQFDHWPGDFSATDVPPRSSWPSVQAGTSLGERIEFIGDFVDRQGHNNSSRQLFHRRFTSRVSGVINR